MSPQPKTGAPLSSEDVGLMVAGDKLRIDSDGALHEFIRAKGGNSRLICTKRVGGNVHRFYSPFRFTFIGRPDADGWIPAPEGGWGENPVPGMRAGYRLRGGMTADYGDRSDGMDWSDTGAFGDIIAIRLPDHISSAGEKVEPANGEVAAAVEGGARMAGVVSMLERVTGPTASVRIYEHEAKLILTALRAQPNGGAK